MNTIIKYFAKKYALSLINDLIANLQNKADIQRYKDKTNNVLKVLTTLMRILDDNTISQEEADQIIDETKNLFK
jgi:DNA mismatch repair ATPase MutL